jgi:hypothetical protein
LGEECIHGFDEGLCAICSPPAEPDPAVTAARSRQVRAPGTSHAAAAAAEARAATAKASARSAASGRAARSTGSTRAARGGSGVGEAPVDAAATRLYHVTHIDNLGRILGAGALLADAGDPPADPVVDLAAPDGPRPSASRARPSPSTSRSCSAPTRTSGSPSAPAPRTPD